MPRKKKVHKPYGVMLGAGLLVALLLTSGIMLHISNERRAEEGWFTASWAITVNNFWYTIFFASLTGTVMAVLLGYILKLLNGGKVKV